MKYEVKKEFLLTANEEEMELLGIAVRNQITALAKEVAESGELILCPDPAFEFTDVTARECFDLFEDLCKAIDTAKSRREYDMTKEGVRNIFEESRKRREETGNLF